MKKVKLAAIILILMISNLYPQFQKTNGIKGGYFDLLAGDDSGMMLVTNRGNIYFDNGSGFTHISNSNIYFDNIQKSGQSWLGVSGNQIVKSENNGLSWQSVLTGIYFNGKLWKTPERIFTLSSDTLYSSFDDGSTWEALKLNTELSLSTQGDTLTGMMYSIQSLYVIGNRIILAGFTTIPGHFTAIIYSDDNGQNWTLTYHNQPSLQVTSIEFYMCSLYISSANGVFWLDADLNWVEINSGFNSTQPNVYKLFNFGDNLYASVLGLEDNLFKFDGVQWVSMGLDTWFGSLIFSNEKFYVTSGWKILSKELNGNWQELQVDVIATTTDPETLNETTVFSRNNNQLYRTTDSGENWEIVAVNAGNFAIKNEKLYLISEGQLKHSADLGESWTNISNGIPQSYLPKMSAVTEVNGELFLGFSGTRARMHLPPVWEQGGVYHSTDGGANWSIINSGLPREGNVPVPVTKLLSSQNFVIAQTIQGTYIFENGAWRNILTGPIQTGNVISFIESKGSIIAQTSKGVFISTDKGVNWELHQNGLPFSTLSWYSFSLFVYQGKPYIAFSETENILYELNSGEWSQSESIELPQGFNVRAFRSFGDALYCGTVENGIWRYNPVPNSVKDSDAPSGFVLSQNYPNPVNLSLGLNSTKINYSVSDASKVKIQLFDINGREIQTLVDNFVNQGNYEVNIDLKELSSGIYFYRMYSNEGVQTKKITIIK